MTLSPLSPTFASHPLFALLPPALLARLGWQALPAQSPPPAALHALGFTRETEQAVRELGAVFAPLWWRLGEQLTITDHVLRLDPSAEGTCRYESPRGAPDRARASAHGRLLTDPAAWTSPGRPLVIVEGERPAALLAAASPDLAIVGCPGVWTATEAPLLGAHLPRLVARLVADLVPLLAQGRPVVLLGQPGGPSPLLGLLAASLRAQKGRVVLAAPPAGAPAHPTAWLEQLAAAPDPAALGAWLDEALALLPDAAPATGRPAGPLLHSLLPEAFRVGPAGMVLPPGYVLLDGPARALATRGLGGGPGERLSSSCFFPVGQLRENGRRTLELAVVLQEGPTPHLEQIRLPRALMHDRRLLCGELASRGLTLTRAAEDGLTDYLSDFLDVNQSLLPMCTLRAQTGWDEDKRCFQYGSTSLGGEGTLSGLDEDQGTQRLVGALRTGGSASSWTAAAEHLFDASPAAALVMAAAIASPMLRLFGWKPIGIVLGALGGAGKSTLLRAAASVFGATGDPKAQPAGLVGKGTGTPKGILMQYRRFSDLPHLMDELRPSTTDERQRNDLADVLHQLYDGEEHLRALRSSDGTRTGLPFAGCLVAAGEVAASDFLKKGGVLRRLLPLPAPYARDGRPLGRFHEVFSRNFGHLGRGLVEALVATPEATRREMASRHKLYHDALDITEQHPEHLRSWSEEIATALAAVDVCAQLMPEVCPHPTRWKLAIHDAWKELCEAEGDASESDLVAQVEEKLRGWLARQRWHLLPSRPLAEKLAFRSALGDRERVVFTPREPIVGQVVEADREGEENEVLRQVDIYQSSLTRFLAAEGYSAGTLTAALAERGFIATTAGQTRQQKASRNVRVQGTVVRVYRLVLERSGPPAVQSDGLEAEVA